MLRSAPPAPPGFRLDTAAGPSVDLATGRHAEPAPPRPYLRTGRGDPRLYLGIDIGKRWHEAALVDDAGATVWRHRIAASRAGVAGLDTQLTGVDVSALTVALEATSVYWLALHAWRTERGVARVVVRNPLQTRAFRNATLRGSKTARIDALALATLVR